MAALTPAASVVVPTHDRNDPRRLLSYRVHPTNASLRVSQIIAGAGTADRRYGGPVPRATIDRYLAGSWLSSGELIKALRLFISGATGGGARDVASELPVILRSKVGSRAPVARSITQIDRQTHAIGSRFSWHRVG